MGDDGELTTTEKQKRALECRSPGAPENPPGVDCGSPLPLSSAIPADSRDIRCQKRKVKLVLEEYAVAIGARNGHSKAAAVGQNRR